MNSNFWDSRTGHLLRWILFLPVAVCAAFIMAFLTGILNFIQAIFDSDTPIEMAELGAPVAFMVTLIYISMIIVPRGAKVIGYTLFSLRLAVTAVALISSAYPNGLFYFILQELFVFGTSLYVIHSTSSD